MLITENTKDYSSGSHKSVDILCDSKRNPKCLNYFSREWRVLVKQRERTGGKDYCKFCQKTEEYTGRNNPNAKYGFNDNFLNSIDTPDKAYLLGWIASDGTIASDKITISIRDYDVDVLLRLRGLLDKNIPIAEKDNMVSLSICSSTMALHCINHLKLNTYGKKSHSVRLPDSINPELVKYFIRGYFEGDGSICLRNNYPRFNITSSSISMLVDINKHLPMCKISSDHLYADGASAIEALEYLYSDNLHLILDRKFELFCKYEDWVPSMPGKGTSIILETNCGAIKINKSRPDAILPTIFDDNASGIDLHLIEKVKDLTDTVSLYTTGIKVVPPKGYYFALVGRSSISKSGYMLANSIGIIDQNYIGEILVALHRSINAKELELPNRLVQLVLLPKFEYEITEVFEIEDTSRGTGGFGSTGGAS